MVSVMKKISFNFDENGDFIVSTRHPITGAWEKFTFSTANCEYVYNAFYLSNPEYLDAFNKAINKLKKLQEDIQPYLDNNTSK